MLFQNNRQHTFMGCGSRAWGNEGKSKVVNETQAATLKYSAITFSIKERLRQIPLLELVERQFLQWLTIHENLEADPYSTYRKFPRYLAEVLESQINTCNEIYSTVPDLVQYCK